MLRGKTLSSLWGPFLGPAIERRSRLGTDKEKGQGFPSACHRLGWLPWACFCCLWCVPLQSQSLFLILNLTSSTAMGGGGGESRRGRRRQHAPGTHLPRAKRNRNFFILTGLFLSSNIFIQIPVKTTSDTGYATMV